ncbi:MAG: replication protein [Lachnoclostridium sp.]|nr:replication protein [Lachnospira sp.]MCM1248894.1 replication protein [Lachnoclostridium sp.]
MTENSQSRKWLLTINNPIEKGFSHEGIENALSKLKSIVYWCLSDETGAEGTFHTHVFLYSTGGIRFSTILKHFKGAHCDIARGTCAENRDYVFKEGKWLGSDKSETNHRETHKESGELPVERQGKRSDLDDLYDMIKGGLCNYDIIEDNPTYMLHLDKIEKVRQTIRENDYREKWRSLEVTYVYGATGSGKTRGIMEKYGYGNVYRVTDYEHPFDSYKGQDVLVFEEFRSSLKIEDMLKYLDGYPLELPARYMNRIACFTKVYLLSNIDIRQQYRFIQDECYETWLAFLRRIHTVHVYSEQYDYEQPIDLYLSDFFPLIEPSPFDRDFRKGGVRLAGK